jgi:hypothetical protein
VGVERQQLKWLAYAAAGFALGVIVVSISVAIDTPRWYDWIANAIFVTVAPGVPIAIGIAILRYRLYEIDVIINRTLVYGSLTAVLVALYFGGVATTQAILQALTGREELPQLVVVASTLVIAALFNPLRRRVQNLVGRSFYRRKYDDAKTLGTFSAKLRDETDLNSLKSDLLSVVRDTMQPEHVSLWVRPEVSVGTSKQTRRRLIHPTSGNRFSANLGE